MAVTREDVLHVSQLARLRLDDDEVERLTAQLNDILSHMDALSALDVAGVEAVGGATEWNAPLRAEDVSPDGLALPPAELAPDWVAGFFTVPRLAALDSAELEEPFENKAMLDFAIRPSPEDADGGTQ